MLGKVAHWLAARHEAKRSASDASIQQRYNALARLKKATTAAVCKGTEGEKIGGGSHDTKARARDSWTSVALPREQRQPLTERELCVAELCTALEECLVMGIKPRGDGQQPSWWHVLYASTLIVDEPTLVQSVVSAAFLSETDVGRARCWLKIALNNHTIESSIMMIFSMPCEHLIRENYDEKSLVRCSEGLGVFLELIIALREVHFAIEVSGEPFQLPGTLDLLDPVPGPEGASEDLIVSITDADIAAAVGALPSKAGSLPETEPAFTDDKDGRSKTQGALMVMKKEQGKGVQSLSHPLEDTDPWHHVFGVSLASLTGNPYHSRYALIDPLLALPNVVDDCVAIVRRKPDTPRLLRATVLSIHLNQLREIVETRGSVPQDLDPQCASALLLDFLKNLPDPLLTDDKYDAFVAAGKLHDEDASVHDITRLVNGLPVHCQIVLKQVVGLMHFLQQPEHSVNNGVDIFTASTVLAPVIAYRKETERDLPPDRPHGRTHSQNQDLRYAAVGAPLVERMIQHYAAIFHSIQVRLVDALERLDAKKKALHMVWHQLKLQPQLNVSSDGQQVDEISRLFSEHLERDALDVSEQRVQTPTQPASSIGSGSSSLTSKATTRVLVTVWKQFGFNRPSILENFENGGVLMLRALLYWLQNNPDALSLLKTHALPSKLPSFDAGLVASSICESLVKLLKLSLTSKQSEIDIVAMSLEPFWELFDEDMYFYKLFAFMFQVYIQLWSQLDPKAASFTRVMTETENVMRKLLKKTSSTVNDLRVEWEAFRTRRPEEADEEDLNEKRGEQGGALLVATPSDPLLMSSPFRTSKKRPSFDFDPDDYKLKLLDSSSILTLEHIAHIDHALPVTSQLCRWFRIYSLESNGSSLETLLYLAKKQSPTLLVVKDAEKNVFGGFASDEWHHAFHYYGTGESFLFSFANSSAAGGFVKYQWSRKNNYFMLCSDTSLVMGGGGNFGLFLDSDLSAGTTGACETFDSPPLTTSQQFCCIQLELWGFAFGDKPVGFGGRRKKSVLD
ncbi:unnamed protein product [Hyaloperonospora brassicae]|uniref:Oxidation resistance protein 1 n=1 Tax=Hyaloperonospora brassicae TaxID=162125 RepID=A0AAV0UX61_HYABA|nr:unnamed protein product [Hyaloperonospora brassicae]